MQGFNMGRYYAPDTENAPTFNKSHPLGSRARPGGALVVRFEMPFAIWCTRCQPHETIIAQGVRFNATKKKVGHYHSTPIYEFGLKHVVCGGEIVVRTDPENTEYVVVSGGRRRDYGADNKVVPGEGGAEVLTAEERERRRADAFAAFEGKKGEVEQRKEDHSRIEELREARDRHWEDPYALNRKLRNAFRVGRKERAKDAQVRDELSERFGLGVEVVEEDEGDRKRAALIEFGTSGDAETSVHDLAAAKPLFVTGAGSKKGAMLGSGSKDATVPLGKTKAAVAAEQRRGLLQQELKGNTRAAMDPFLSEKPHAVSAPVFAGLKRKRALIDSVGNGAPTVTGEPAPLERISSQEGQKAALALVSYDSD